MSLAKWAAKNMKGKGAKIGEMLGEGAAKAQGGIEGLLSAAGETGSELFDAGGNVLRGVAAAHPGKTAGTAALLGAVGMHALDGDDGDEDDPAPPSKSMYRGKKKNKAYC